MSSKMSVFFWVLYLLTVVWSIGLDSGQISKLVVLFWKHDVNNIGIFPNDAILNYLSDVGYTSDFEQSEFEKNKHFPCFATNLKRLVVKTKTMSEFLILLADNNKTTDVWMIKGLTTYEVKLFVRMFDVQDKRGKHDGLLTGDELNKLLEDHFNLKDDYKLNIRNEFKNGEPINVLLYLAAILKHKFEGQHLNKAQIDKCHELYVRSKKHLDSGKQKALFKTLNIVSDDYKYLLDFEHIRPAAQELQELLVFWSEYDKNFDRRAPCITHVRQYIWDFTAMYDKNHDGLVTFQEFEEAASIRASDDMEPFLESFLPDRSRPMNAAMFLSIKLYMHPTDYREEYETFFFL